MTKTLRHAQRSRGEKDDPLEAAQRIRHGAYVSDVEYLRSLAAHQHGLVSRTQIREAGFDRFRVRRLVIDGYLTFITPRVLRIGGSAISPWQSVMAAVLDVGYDATASHLTAAAMWGVKGIRAEPVHVSMTRVLRRRDPVAATVHHLTLIPDGQRTHLHDIPVTAPPLTVLLVCGLYGPYKAARVLDHLLAARLLTVEETWTTIDGMSKQGRNGLTDIRKLLEDRSDHEMPPQSNNERRWEDLAFSAGIITLKRQVDIGVDSWIGRVDYADTEVPLIVEIHSERYHTSWAHRKADTARIAKLEAAGYTVVVIWDYEIWSNPDAAIERVLSARRALAAR